MGAEGQGRWELVSGGRGPVGLEVVHEGLDPVLGGAVVLEAGRERPVLQLVRQTLTQSLTRPSAHHRPHHEGGQRREGKGGLTWGCRRGGSSSG